MMIPLLFSPGLSTDLAPVALELSVNRARNAELVIKVRNQSADPQTVNLGMSLGNGAKLVPSNFTFVFQDGGKKVRAQVAGAGVAGRIDDYMVPIGAGGSYELRIRLDQLMTDQGRIGSLLSRFKSVVATLDSGEMKFINSDTEGLRSLRYWRGETSSKTLQLKD